MKDISDRVGKNKITTEENPFKVIKAFEVGDTIYYHRGPGYVVRVNGDDLLVESMEGHLSSVNTKDVVRRIPNIDELRIENERMHKSLIGWTEKCAKLEDHIEKLELSLDRWGTYSDTMQDHLDEVASIVRKSHEVRL